MNTIAGAEESVKELESFSTCSYSDNEISDRNKDSVYNEFLINRKLQRRLYRELLESRKSKTREVYNKLMKDYREIEELGERYVEQTEEQLPGRSILEKVSDLVKEFQGFYYKIDEFYLIHLPNGNVKMRLSKGEKSWSLYVSDHHLSLVILDYIEKKLSQEFPIGTPSSKIVDIASKY